jgi:hypothetical protein
MAPKKKVTSQMLLNKFQRDRERQQYREEAARRNKGHWRCPFFVYGWEERWTLPIADNYPECNGFYRDDRSYKKPRVDLRPQGPIIRERSDERRTPMHDQLGGRVSVCDPLGGRIPADERLEQMANDRIKDDQPLHSDPERESQFMIILIGLSGIQRV